MSNELIPFERQIVLAEAFAKSRLFGCETKEQALSLMALCEAQGLHPANAVQEYHIISGRPSLKADAMLTRFQRAGGRVEFTSYTDEKVEAKFSHPQGGSLTVSWDMARAKRAQLTTAMWTKYPRQMLRSRVISEGVRALFPGVLGGMYAPEEVQDFAPPANVTPIVVSPDPPPSEEPNSVASHVVQFCADADEGNETAIRERWDAVKSDQSIGTEVWRTLKRQHPVQFKIIEGVLRPATEGTRKEVANG